MTITKERTTVLVKRFGANENDTGNPAVQVAILTERINSLTSHLKEHKNDKHSRRGLLKMVSKRRSLLDYIKGKDAQAYLDLIAALNIRK